MLCAASLTVVVPVLHDDEVLAALLAQLATRGVPCIVVDGAASTATQHLVASHGSCYLAADGGRGGQIAAGCQATTSEWIWVLHADNTLDDGLWDVMLSLCGRQAVAWGRFDVTIPGLQGIAWFMNWRSRLTRICTGDQAMFFHRSLLESIGGFPEQPLMEDIEVSKRLARRFPEAYDARPETITASPRRWRRHGVLRTVLTMWWFRLRYFCGTPAAALYRSYYRTL